MKNNYSFIISIIWITFLFTFFGFENTQLYAQCVTSTGCNLGSTNEGTSTIPTPSCSYQNLPNGAGSGSRRTYTGFNSGVTYQFTTGSGGQNVGNISRNGSSLGSTNVTLSGATSYNLGRCRTSAISCGTWNGSSAILQFRIAPPTTANAGSNVNTCNGSTTLSGNSPSVGSGSWSKVSGSGSITSGGSVSGIAVNSSGTFRYTINNGGCSSTDDVTVFNRTPTAVSVSGGGTFCTSTNITASGGTGGIIYFQGTNSGGESTVTPSTSETITSSGTYYFRARSSTGCWGSEGSVTVTIITPPSSPPSTTNVTPSVECENSLSPTIQLIASGGSPGTGGNTNWYSGSCGGTFVANGSSPTIPNPGVTTTYYVRYENSCGVTTCEEVTYTVDDLPVASAGGSATICEDGSATVSGASANNGTILWTSNGNGILTGATTLTPTYTAVSSDANSVVTLTMTVTSNNACGTATDTYLVNVISCNTSWIGVTSTDWNTGSNWSSGSVPLSIENATISSSASFMPHIENGNFEITNLNVNSGANLTIAEGASLTVSGDLQNNGDFTIESEGALVQTLGSSISGSGIFFVERTVGVSNPWFMGSPIDNQDIFNFGINPIQVVGGDGVQFNPQGSCDPSDIDVPGEFVMQLNEDANIIDDCSNSLWHYRSAGNLSNARGYAVYTTSGNTLEFQGTVNNGDISYGDLGRQAGTVMLPSGFPETRGWHLVSNPYPSPITLTGADLTDLGFNAQIHRWNAGVWVSSNPLSPVTIAVGQGFQIRKTTEGGAVDFSLDNSFRTTDAATFYKDNNGLGQNLSITLSNEDYENIGFIYFKEGATPYFDPEFDVNRLFGLAHIPLTYTISADNERLAYNALPLLEADVHTTVPLAVYDGNPGAFTLTFEELNSLETETQNVTVILEDLKLDEMIQISEGTTYDFVTEADDAAERFVVHFYPVAKEIEQEEEEEEIEEEEEVLSINDLQNQVIGLFPNPTESKATLMLDMNHTFTNVQVVSITGKVVHTYNIENGQTNVHIDLSGMSAGVYLVQVKGAHGQTVRKLMKQ